MNLRSRFIVNLNLLASNFSLLKKRCPQNEIIFMVKANGYGHGTTPITQFANSELGVKEFGVAGLEEGLQLRNSLPDGRFDVYVFSDTQLFNPKALPLYLNHRLLPVVSSLAGLEVFLQFEGFKNLPLSLKFNLGMNRLGILPENLEKVIELLKEKGRASLHHLMGHFSHASMPMDADISQNQIENFKKIKSELKANGILIERSSLSNSGAIIQNIGHSETHIRPGLLLYGPSPIEPAFRTQIPWAGKTISRFETHVLQTFRVKKGTPIGYGGKLVPRDGLCALIGLGYGDGIPNQFSGSQIFHEEQNGELIGSISMDMAHVLFPLNLERKIKVGETVKVWGNDPKEILNLSDNQGTIPYELLCQITSRVPRIYELK